MGRKQKNYHYIYKTINLINGKYYIGMHSTDNLNDGYVGSGKRLWYSIKKYGKENFKCEILEFLPDRRSLKDREKELVNENILKDSMCLNIKQGGEGGFSSEEHRIFFFQKAKENAKINSIKGTEKLKWLYKNNQEWKSRLSKKLSESGKGNQHWLGKKHKEESKQKMSKPKNQGEKNSQFGTIWITNGIENKKVKKDSEIPNGWYRGRLKE